MNIEQFEDALKAQVKMRDIRNQLRYVDAKIRECESEGVREVELIVTRDRARAYLNRRRADLTQQLAAWQEEFNAL